MKLNPTTYHRMRFEAALHFEATSPRLDDAGAWGSADAFLAAGGYECGEEALGAEPASDDWEQAALDLPDWDGYMDSTPGKDAEWLSRRAHELARQRSQK